MDPLREAQTKIIMDQHLKQVYRNERELEGRRLFKPIVEAMFGPQDEDYVKTVRKKPTALAQEMKKLGATPVVNPSTIESLQEMKDSGQISDFKLTQLSNKKGRAGGTKELKIKDTSGKEKTFTIKGKVADLLTKGKKAGETIPNFN